MTTMHTNPVEDKGFTDTLTGGLIAGLVGVLFNNLYSDVYRALTEFDLPELVHIGTIALASFFTCLMAAIVYFFLARYTKQPRKIFYMIAGIILAVSLIAPFTATMPDGSPVPEGFLGLTIPMHFISAFFAVWIIPQSRRIFKLK